MQTTAEDQRAHRVRLAAAVAFWAMTVVFVADTAVLAGWVGAGTPSPTGAAADAEPASPPAADPSPTPSPVVSDGPQVVEFDGATVTFPVPVQQTSQPREIAGELTTVEVATGVDEDGTTFNVAVVDYPDTVDLSDPAVNLLASVSGAAGNIGGRIMEQTVTLYDEAPAITFRIETPNARLAGRNVLVGRRMYAQSVVYRGEEDPPGAKSFFDSFRLTDSL